MEQTTQCTFYGASQTEADKRQADLPYYHLPALTATGWHDQPADTETQDSQAAMQADMQHAAQPHHHLPALTAAGWHDQPPDTEMQDSHAAMQANKQHAPQPHHHLPALTATGRHDQPAVTETQATHAATQADMQHAAQPHHHLPALTAAGWHDQPAVTETQATHAATQADMQHAAQPHHHLPALTAAGWHDQPAVKETQATHTATQADMQHAAQPHHHLPALTAAGWHDQPAVTETQATHAATQADMQHAAQPHHHLPALTAAGWHDQPAVTETQATHAATQADMQHAAQPHHHLPALTAAGWHDQPAVTETQATHTATQADKQHAPQPHHHLPALTATGRHDQPAVTETQATHAATQADMQHAAQPHHHLPALTAAGWHDQPAVKETQATHTATQADMQHAAQPHHHLPALTAAGWHDQPAVTETQATHAATQADMQHAAQPHHHLPALTAAGWHDQPAVTETQATHAATQADMQHAAQPHHHLPALTAAGWHDQPAVTETQATHTATQADKQHAPQPHHHLPALTATGRHDQPAVTETQATHAATQADMQHAAQPHHHLPALTAAGWHDQPAVTETQATHAATQADMQHAAQPHHHLPALTAAGWHDQPAATETQATHAVTQADMQHAAQPHHHLPALTAAGWHDQPAVTETQATHAATQADMQHAAQPHHHLPALTAAGWHDQPAVTETQATHTATQADMQHAAQPHHHLPALTAAGWHDQPAATETWTCSVTSFKKTAIDNMDRRYTIITPMPNPPFGHPNWTPIQQLDMNRQIVAYLACMCLWISMCMKRHQPTYSHTKSRKCLKKQHKTLAKLNASLHNTTHNWLLGIDGTLPSATAITRLNHIAYTYLKGHNSGRTIRAIQYNTTLQAYMTYYLNPNTSSSPTWLMAISTYMARCIHISWLLLAAGDIEPNPGPDGLYFEQQVASHCQIHALNMAAGHSWLTNQELANFHTSELHARQGEQRTMWALARDEQGSLPHIYDESGNFTISTMNHYLYHYHKDLHLCPAATELTPGNITPELLTTLTDRIDSYTNTAAILITHNHATTIRHIDNAWQWLDSERGRPWRLDTPEDWLQLHGMLVLIKKGDAANTNLIQPLCWLADPTRRATTEQLEQHLRAAHVDLTNDLRTQPAHSPRSDRPPPKVGTAQPASNKRDATATEDTYPANKHAQSRQRQAAPTVTLSTPQSRTRSDKRPTSTGHPNGTFRRRTKPKAQPRDSHKQTLIYQYTAPTPPPAAHPTDNPSVSTEAQHSTLPTRQPQPTHNRQHITLTTLNVRSLHRSRKDVLNLVHQHSPDILVLTETMTQPKSNNPGSGWLKRVMPDYTTHRHRGHSEVLIGIKHNLAIQMQTKMLPLCTDAEVNARCVILTLNQHRCEQLTIIATYWPSGNNGDALSLRGKMQEHIRTATGHLPGSLILAGDINATMKTEDRSEHTEYTQDNMMRGFATEMHLKEADPDDRAWTYQQPHCKSRIDAILTRDARHGPEHRTHIDTNAYLSDHRPLTATLNTARLGIALAAPHKPPKHIHTILTTPITNKDREAYRQAVQQPRLGVDGIVGWERDRDCGLSLKTAKAQAGAAEAETQAQADAGAYEADEAGADEAGAYEADAGAYDAGAYEADAGAYEAGAYEADAGAYEAEAQAQVQLQQQLDRLQQQLEAQSGAELQRQVQQQLAAQQHLLQQQQADLLLKQQQVEKQPQEAAVQQAVSMRRRYLVLDNARQAGVCSMPEADVERMRDKVEGCRAMHRMVFTPDREQPQWAMAACACSTCMSVPCLPCMKPDTTTPLEPMPMFQDTVKEVCDDEECYALLMWFHPGLLHDEVCFGKLTNTHCARYCQHMGLDRPKERRKLRRLVVRDLRSEQLEFEYEPHVQAQLTNTYRDQIHQLDDDDSALAIAQARVRMQHLISTQPKKANKRILRPSRTDHKGLQALADPETKTICTAPADLNRIITAAYGQKLSAPTTKTGHYTNTQTRNYPWARAKADDAFAMHACQKIHWLHTAIMDKAGFQECLSRLAGGKAPGPDGVENEIIKMLPWEMRETIHKLFIIMWATGCTPTTWKTNDTCLLYKDKGEETDLNSYRPVGLANTVYKLWTSLITKTLSEYAEANGMLSKNQAGFRSHRNTTQQLQMLVMALEDAKLAKADIYALLVDFTSAFNTTCQDKLLWIMHDLGFPTDAPDAVKDLNTGATTRFKTPYGHTDPVPVNRGTIQGDSLSPFLFLIYIEPLLRWLQVGARGYKFKSATDDSGERATVSSIDYADDIAILCNTLRNRRCQADKLSAFSDWGHLIISHSKTLATAALHHSVETGMCSNAAEADKRARQQLQTISLQGKPVTYHRPTSPFTYLGVLITMTLDWKPQHTAMITQLRQKLERLRRSFASATQAIHIIRTAIIPSLAYSFCAVPCTPGDLELYDRSINQCVKLKLRLPLGTPNAIIREDAGKLGMGISSTAQEYHARNTTALTHSLQSTDVTHAHISRSMLHKQITWLSTQASTQGHRMLTLLHHTLRARQLVYASISGLSATEEGLPLYHEECQTLGRLITQASSSQAHDVVSASITCLKSLGVTHASELSCKGNTHIITGSMLTSKYGKKVKQKHIIALNKLAAMAAQPSCPDATVTRTIRDSRNTSLDLPPDQRKITTWAAGLTELAPTPAVPDTRTRYMDMKAYAVKHATQPATADRTAAAPAVHDATRTSSRLLKREQRATQSAPAKPTPPKAGMKRNNEGRQIQTIPEDIVHIIGLDLPGLSSWKVDKACRCKPKDLGSILGAMYGHQEAITSIDGWQWDGINKESYYKVHWKPTVIDRWALPLCAEEGYTPTHIETISREEAKDVCTCELCWLPRGDSPTCHNCKRAYHTACLEQAHLSGHKEPGYWLCPICKFGSNDFKTTMRQSAHSDLIRVHWHPTLEPAPLITAHLDYTAKRNDYDEENKQIREARHARPDANLPAHTRQGLPDPHTWLPRCTNLHSKATFHTYPINPQTDIVGTGNCETFLQLHPHMTTPAMSLSTREPIMPKHDLVQHVTVHDESGRTIGLLTKQQHQHLHTWLQHTPHTRNLATELVALLRRQDTQSNHHPMRAAQDKALATLHTTRSFPSTVQRWADPLTVRPETTTYWSPDINDTAFGAHHNCLLVRHTGLSTWNVPADDAMALKCVNHAIHSATQEEAMATIMLIPGKKGISYPKHMDTLRRYPEYCQHLASIPSTKTRCPKPGKHANLHIYVIWNAAGRQLVTKGNPQGWLASTATALHPQRDTHPIRNRPTKQSQPATPPSGHKQHMRLPLDRDLPTSGHQRSHQPLTQHSTTQPRMAITEWATIAYSDGSCIKASGADPARVGAGVYIPENNILITVALDNPESNTINKAELTAIYAALKAGAKRIATDSLCSLYQIRRSLANPMSLITHRHNDILTAIATLIIDSPATIQFYKVRAHSGIIGNEGADALAKHAALHSELANTPAYSPTTRKETTFWLSTAADSESPAPLPDCRQSMRAHMHHKHKLGLANQDSIYYLMSQEITKVAAPSAGDRVMTDTNISTHAQRTALLYRTGGLYNQKLALRWKRASDDRCPLCGDADSATHLLSGCSETLPLVQERHNGAGRLIVKAISKGTLGGYIRFADTGSWEKGAKKDLDLPNDTLHTTLRSLGLKTAATKNTTRPDILMVTPQAKAGSSGKVKKRVTIIEIKYCSDSRWTDQLDRATNQHTNLAQAIRKEGHMVEIRPILLGIGGTTYETHTRQHLLALGVTQANTNKLSNKLTRHAVESAHSIAKTSYRLRATKGGGG
ncbi:hypothetical protein QJQ45_004218 [Haematococcus lacustris]|nr:hypothetical protein QJQ45_004218 [Haematococcus lacustris]